MSKSTWYKTKARNWNWTTEPCILCQAYKINCEITIYHPYCQELSFNEHLPVMTVQPYPFLHFAVVQRPVQWLPQRLLCKPNMAELIVIPENCGWEWHARDPWHWASSTKGGGKNHTAFLHKTKVYFSFYWSTCSICKIWISEKVYPMKH